VVESLDLHLRIFLLSLLCFYLFLYYLVELIEHLLCVILIFILEDLLAVEGLLSYLPDKFSEEFYFGNFLALILVFDFELHQQVLERFEELEFWN